MMYKQDYQEFIFYYIYRTILDIIFIIQSFKFKITIQIVVL